MSGLMHIHRSETKLEQPLRRTALPDAVNPSEDSAHHFEITVTLDGRPVTAERAEGLAVRPDGVTVLISAAAEDGVISLTLPANALTVPGEVQLIVNAMSGESVTTVLWCTLTVLPGRTDEIADPEALVPSLEQLLACTADCAAAAQDARAAAALLTTDQLAKLFCPAFRVTAADIACHPLPGSTVTVSAQDMAQVNIRGSVQWKRNGFTGGANYYYLTGSNTGNDVALPAGDWVIGWRVHTEHDFAENGAFVANVRIGTSPTMQFPVQAWEGAFTVTLETAGTLSCWMVNNNDRWNALDKPEVDLVIADAAVDPEEAGVFTPVITGGRFTAPERQTLHIWTADGSQVSASGYTDPVWLHSGEVSA